MGPFLRPLDSRSESIHSVGLIDLRNMGLSEDNGFVIPYCPAG
jgi:hypothetical protein